MSFLSGKLVLPAVFCVLALATGTPAWGSNECPTLPEGLVVQPGHIVRLGGLSFQVSTRHVSGKPYDSLEIDLLARPLTSATRQVQIGSFIPHLDVVYSLDTPTTTLEAGKLGFRVSGDGPSYGTTVPLATVGDEPLRLVVTIDGDPPGRPDCPRLPLELSFRLPRGTDAHAATPTAVSDDRNFTLLGTLDPLPAISSPYNDIWGYSNGTTHLAIMSSRNGTHFIDVTVPASPVEIGFISGPESSWRDIKTYGDNAYIVTEGGGTGQGMQIVDLSNPLVPNLVNTYTATFTTAHNLFIDVSNGHAWAVGTNNATRILNLAPDPDSPVEIGMRGEFYIHDAYVAGGYAYLSEISEGRQRILNSSDVANLVDLGAWETPGVKAHNSWANDAQTLLATTDEVTGGHVAVYDITDKSGPIPLLSEYTAGEDSIVHNVIFDDEDNHRIAISYYTQGCKYVDLYRPTVPVELGSYDTFPDSDTGGSGAWGVYPFDPRGYIYVSDRQTGLYVLEYTPGGGTLSGVVRDSVDDTPIPDVVVAVLTEDQEVVTTSEGVFAIYAEGEPVLRVAAWGYRTGIGTPGIMPIGGRLDQDLLLERLPRVSLSGSILRLGDLAGIEGATVAIAGSNLTTTSGAGGTFFFPEVAIGQQIVTAERFGYASQEARIVLTAGQSDSTDLILEPGAIADDVEIDLGWTLSVPGDGATGGLWERVDPNGTGDGTVQPEDDRTPAPGTIAFITGQSAPGATTEDNDVTGGSTTLLSPALDVSTFDVAVVRYHSWFSNDTGVIPAGTLQVDISSTSGGLWTALQTQDSTSNSWTRSEFDIGSHVSLSDQVRVRFVVSSIYPDEIQTLEAGIDDVDVVRACLARFNPENPDSDQDGTVDGCDACRLDPANDVDGDGVCGNVDNAPFNANAGQADGDGDQVGDVIDNCPADPNVEQRDLDGDGLGDACDDDLDGDGTLNARDLDQDDDGVNDLVDVCPSVPDPDQADFDSDTVGNACDPDDGLVNRVRLQNDWILWEPEAGADTYNIYRGAIGPELLLPFADCRIAGASSAFFIDPDLPIPGEGFLYLVTAVVDGAEGPVGFKSDGTPREINTACP